MAAAGLDHHVAVLPQDDVVAAVVVEHGGGAQLGGCAARLGDCIWLHQVHLANVDAGGGISDLQLPPAPHPDLSQDGSQPPMLVSCDQGRC